MPFFANTFSNLARVFDVVEFRPGDGLAEGALNDEHALAFEGIEEYAMATVPINQGIELLPWAFKFS